MLSNCGNIKKGTHITLYHCLLLILAVHKKWFALSRNLSAFFDVLVREITMLLKVRRCVTIGGAFLFVLSVTYTAITIDASLKKDAIKKLNLRKKEFEDPKSSPAQEILLSHSAIPTTTSTKMSNVKKERRKSIGTSFEGGFGSLLSIRIDKWFPTNAPGPQVLPKHSSSAPRKNQI